MCSGRVKGQMSHFLGEAYATDWPEWASPPLDPSTALRVSGHDPGQPQGACLKSHTTPQFPHSNELDSCLGRLLKLSKMSINAMLDGLMRRAPRGTPTGRGMPFTPRGLNGVPPTRPVLLTYQKCSALQRRIFDIFDMSLPRGNFGEGCEK